MQREHAIGESYVTDLGVTGKRGKEGTSLSKRPGFH